MKNIYSMNYNIKEIIERNPEFQIILERKGLLHEKFNSYPLKSFEYIFIQIFSRKRTFKRSEISKFLKIYFEYFYFQNDLKKHFKKYFCEKIDRTGKILKLKNLNWAEYFQNPKFLKINDFLELNETNQETEKEEQSSHNFSHKIFLNLDFNLYRIEKIFIYNDFWGFRDEIIRGDFDSQISFFEYYERDSVLKKFWWKEAFVSFNNLKKNYLKIKNRVYKKKKRKKNEKRLFMETFDYLICSVFQRILSLG